LEPLQELGGTATSSDIVRLAREKYPDLSLWQYVGNRLRKLRRSDFIGYDVVTNKYFIVKEEAEVFGQLSS
jgi:hypothetical protein